MCFLMLDVVSMGHSHCICHCLMTLFQARSSALYMSISARYACNLSRNELTTSFLSLSNTCQIEGKKSSLHLHYHLKWIGKYNYTYLKGFSLGTVFIIL